MNQTQITKCPKCDTTFRVSPAQLQVAKGAVRCGACLHVFRASDHFQVSKKPEPVVQDDRTQDMFGNESTQPQPAAPKATPKKVEEVEQAPAKAKTPEPAIDDSEFDLSQPLEEDVTSTDIDDDDDDFLIDDDNGLIDDGDDDLDDHSGRKSPIINDLNEDFLSLDIENDADPFYTESDKLRDKVEVESDSDDESWAQSLLDDSDEPEEKETKKVLKPAPSSPNFTYIEADPLDLSLPNQASRRQFWIWGSIALLFSILLAVQLAYFNFNQWARLDQFRPYYALVCEQVGCRLPSSYDLKQIRTTASPQVSSHAKFKDALTVDVLFMNHATYEQAFPKLELTFTDKNDKVIAHRLFSPREYLAGEASGLSMMPVETPIHIALEIKDPGPNANNYQVRFVAP